MHINISVDLDGVCANFSKKFSEVANKIYGDRCYIIDNQYVIKDWDWENWYSLTKSECKNVWAEIIKTKNFWTELEVLHINQWEYFVNKINDNKFVNVYFITSREPTDGYTVARQSSMWLEKNGWKYPFVIESHQKEKFIEDLDIKMFIDDKAENVISVKNHNPECIVYSTDVPYNLKKLEESKVSYKRVGGLQKFTDDVINYIETQKYKLNWKT